MEYQQDVQYWTVQLASAEEVKAPAAIVVEYKENLEHALYMAQKED